MIITDPAILDILSEDLDEDKRAPDFERGPSLILVHYTPDEIGPNHELLAYDGGDAAIIAEGGFLFEEIEEHLYPFPEGWYVIEGFRAEFTEDWSSSTIKRVRPATGKDLIQFRVASPWQGLKYDLNELRIALAHTVFGLKRRLF